MKKWIFLLAGLAIAAPLHAESAASHPAQAAATMSEGVVRKIDAANAKITLRHGPITNLDIPAMTMMFRVQSPEQLNAVKLGDKVKFHAERIDGTYTVTEIRVVP
ncbi:MAG: copper-binding protein [Thiobacillus sp.]|jgi:Cu/Ag efflux protein CusF|uniref:copper-binding protein n=1 Tax=Thiobacillus sp. TaxID=924 RepID=UPI0028959457|nr:copper-binding protein [Thiobacillus sp.]MDT3707040.1 copper-binding protein [Thiobacillus sp.]